MVRQPRIRAPRWWRTPELLVCAIRGHAAAASSARTVRPEHAGIVWRTVDGHRLARCLRCDAWVEAPEAKPTADLLAPLTELAIPRLGLPLRDALVLRLIAVERAVHA